MTYFAISTLLLFICLFIIFFILRLQADLLAGIQALRHMSRACHASLPPAAVEVMLGYVTYGGHVTNGLDLNAVKSMANVVATEQVKMVSSLVFCS